MRSGEAGAVRGTQDAEVESVVLRLTRVFAVDEWQAVSPGHPPVHRNGCRVWGVPRSAVIVLRGSGAGSGQVLEPAACAACHLLFLFL